ncbi:methyltransferase family protein [Chryseobacterium sp.]|uniref:methyltransferase family protein n=1 Tax=Chryseobacterium sp. TaxID=1871047 RepID=UPI00388D02E5
MNTIIVLFYVLMILWFVSELFYKKTLLSKATDYKEQGFSVNILWTVFMVSIFSAVTVSHIISNPIYQSITLSYFALILIFASILARYFIIRALGRFFTVDVSIKDNHSIKKDGFYRFIRHPSYLFSLITFLSLGLFLNNCISLIVIIVPTFLAYSYRIKIEENLLQEKLGNEYKSYMKTTKKLIPFIY